MVLLPLHVIGKLVLGRNSDLHGSQDLIPHLILMEREAVHFSWASCSAIATVSFQVFNINSMLFSLAGDFGFDPLGLAEDPASLRWYVQAELVHCRFAMLGVFGILVTDVSNTQFAHVHIINIDFRNVFIIN